MRKRIASEKTALINRLIGKGLPLEHAIRMAFNPASLPASLLDTIPANDPASVPSPPAVLVVNDTASPVVRDPLITASLPPGVNDIAPGWYTSDGGNLCYRGPTLPSIASTDPASVQAFTRPSPATSKQDAPAVASVQACQQAPTSKQVKARKQASKQAPPAVPSPPADQTQSYRPAFTCPFY